MPKISSISLPCVNTEFVRLGEVVLRDGVSIHPLSQHPDNITPIRPFHALGTPYIKIVMRDYLGALVALYASWSLVTLRADYKRASSVGIPLVWVPVDGLDIQWQVLWSHILKVLLPVANIHTLHAPACIQLTELNPRSGIPSAG